MSWESLDRSEGGSCQSGQSNLWKKKKIKEKLKIVSEKLSYRLSTYKKRWTA